jgi:hypothetical protein
MPDAYFLEVDGRMLSAVNLSAKVKLAVRKEDGSGGRGLAEGETGRSGKGDE